MELDEILKLHNGARIELNEMVDYSLTHIEEYQLIIFNIQNYKIYTTLKHDGTEFYLRYNISFKVPANNIVPP